MNTVMIGYNNYSGAEKNNHTNRASNNTITAVKQNLGIGKTVTLGNNHTNPPFILPCPLDPLLPPRAALSTWVGSAEARPTTSPPTK